MYWTVGDNARFASSQVLRDRGGRSLYTLDGASLVALVDAESGIADAYGLRPTLLISSSPGLNAAALEINGRSLVFVNADAVNILGSDRDLWAALFGHEFGHLYHHHSAVSQARITLIKAAAIFLDSYEARKGHNVAGLVDFGANMMNNAFTRDQEREADATGVRFMAQAGFDPQGAVRLQELLVEKYGSTGLIATFLQTHPSGEERIRNIRAEIAALPPGAILSRTESVSADEFGRHLALCDSNNAQVPSEKRAFADYTCLRDDSPELAKRFALCWTDLKARNGLTAVTLSQCASQSPASSDFSYVSWRTYCQLDTAVSGRDRDDPTKANTECLFGKAERVALRGTMCETEAQQTRVPAERMTTMLTDCSRELGSLSERFDRYTWSHACRRKSVALSSDPDIQRTIMGECMAEAPAESVSGTMSSIEPDALLASIKAALANRPPTTSDTLATDCDRQASLEGLPGVRQRYLGWIDAPSAEAACLSAVKGNRAGRSEAHLAAVYLQQGQWTDALSLATKAAATPDGRVEATTLLGIMNGQGLGVEKQDGAKAIELLSRAASLGSIAAVTALGSAFENGFWITQDIPTAVTLYQLAAEHGDVSANAALARLYLSGVDVHQDIPGALRLFRLATDDYPPALRGYAIALASTPGDHKAEFEELTRRAVDRVHPFADNGSLPAKLMMGWFYQRGFGVLKDPVKAFNYFEQTADIGYPAGEAEVAYCYLNGSGVTASVDTAKAFFRKAADKGVREASVELVRLDKAPIQPPPSPPAAATTQDREDDDTDHACGAAQTFCREGMYLCAQYKEDFRKSGRICPGVTDSTVSNPALSGQNSSSTSASAPSEPNDENDPDHSCRAAQVFCREGSFLCPQYREDFRKAGRVCPGVTMQ
jgi:hypothetical protein